MTRFSGHQGAAVLVIDAQQGLAAQLATADRVAEVLAGVVARARLAGVPVIWLRRQGAGLASGEPAWQLVDALVTEPGEAQLEHPWADAFIGTGLAETLGGLGAGRVWLGGFGSDDGVLQTYLGALYRGFDATLIEDGHAAAEAVFDDWRWPAEQVTAFVNRIVWRDLTPEATGNLMASGNIEFATEGPDDAELLAQAEAEAAAGEEAADRLAGSPGQTGSDD